MRGIFCATYFPLSRLTHRINENSSLSFSNNDRHIFWYILYVKYLFRASIRLSKSDDFSLLFIACHKKTQKIYLERSVYEINPI